MDIYAQNILDRYKTPCHKDKVVSQPTFEHTEANHSCGDKVTVRLRLADGAVKGYGFTGEGCAISMAAADMIGDLVDGMNEDEMLALKKEDIYEMLGIEISLRRSKCALLCLLALQNGLLKYRSEEPIGWTFYHL